MPISKKKTRIDKGTLRLTSRDIKMFRWIGDMDQISIDLFQILLARLDAMEWLDDGYTVVLDVEKFLASKSLTVQRAYQMISRLSEHGYVEYTTPWANRPGWLRLTKKAIELTGRSYKERDLSPLKFNHVWASNFVRLWFESWLAKEGYTQYEIKTSRMFEQGLTDLYPDMTVRYGELFASIEVELTEKTHLIRYEKLKTAYRDMGFDVHFYFVPEKEGEKIKKHFARESAYKFLVLDGRTLDDGTKYQYMGL